MGSLRGHYLGSTRVVMGGVYISSITSTFKVVYMPNIKVRLGGDYIAVQWELGEASM
jgi:hypothetical protein